MLTRLIALIAVVIMPACVLAQPVADRVPANSIIYIGWEGSAHLGPAYPQSNLKAMLDDSNIPELINTFLPALMDKAGQMNPQAGEIGHIVASIAKPSWEHPTAFFFAGVQMPQGGQPTPQLGVIWEPGADADSLAKQLEQLVGQVPAPFPIKVVKKKDVVALMVGYPDAEAALTDAETKSLAGDAAFKTTLSRLSVKEPVSAAYIDYQKILGMLDDMIRMSGNAEGAQIWPKVRDQLGLTGLKRIAIASGFDGKDWGTQAFVEAPEPRSGLLKLAGAKPLGQEILVAIPKTATMAGAGRFNVAGLFDLIHKTVESVDANSIKEFDQVLEKLDTDSGVDIQKELLASLGDEWAYYADPTIGGPGLASLTIVNHLKDADKFEQSLSRIEDYAAKQASDQAAGPMPVTISFHTTKVDGMTIHYLGIPFVAPSWVVHDGNVYVALFPQVAVAAARHVSSKGPSILENPGFMQVRTRLGHNQPSSLSFMDLPKTAPQAYGSWLVVARLIGFSDMFGVTSPPLILPELPKLQAHLSPAGGISWADAEGFHARMIEPFPGSTMIASDPMISAIYAEPALVAILLPALNRAREQANRVKSASNLKQIGLAAMMYANSHQNRFPPDLAALAKDEDLTAMVFVNPRTSAQPPPAPPADPKALAQWVQEHSDYVWVGGGKTTAATAETVLAYEKPESVSEGVNILYGDGHVEWLAMPEAQEQIQKANQGKAPAPNGNL
jgi:prepilin-type processing-associated H-X9-DG protein